MSSDRTLGLRTRLLLETAAALAVVAAGIRTHATGMVSLDVVLTVLCIVGVANSFRLLDCESGLSAAVAAVGAAATFVLAALGNQRALAHASGALAAGCVAYWFFTARPGFVRFGKSGSFFLGFALAVAVLALRLESRVDHTTATLVPLLILALPVLNASVVLLGRSRRRLPVLGPVPDHLVQRLGAAAMGPAVAVLIGTELFAAGLAVLVGRSMIHWATALGFAAVLLAVLLVSALKVSAYSVAPIGLPRPVRLAAGGLLAVSALASVAAAAALVAARGPLRNGADTAAAALNAARDGDYQRANVLFTDSERSFSLGRTRLEGPLPSLGLLVPVVSSNVKAARLLARVGTDLAASGRSLATQVRPEELRMQGGALPLAEIRRVSPALREAADVLERSQRRIGDADLPFLFGPVRDALTLVGERLNSVSGTAKRAADAAALAPRILGDDHPRRYLLAIQNPAESRATGGFLGNFGELVADGGRISLVKFGSLDNLRDEGVPFNQRTLDAPVSFTRRFADRMPEIKSWTHVNLTPDFPTVARLMTSLYPQSGGQRIDGVIAVDPVGLSALLKLTGPVEVPGWPVPLDAGNIVSVTTREQYEPNISYDERRDFLGAVAETVWRRVSSTDLGTPYAIGDALGPATNGRHIQIALARPVEARFARDLGIAGAVPAPRSDSLLVVNHNAGGNKVDIYLHRDIAYRIRLRPDIDGTATVTGVLDVTLRNDAPATGLPLGVLGDPKQPINPGENFSLASVVSPLSGPAMLVDDKRYPFRSDADLGQLVHSTFLRVPPLSELKMQLLLSGRVPLVGGDTYVLDLLHQARVQSDRVTVTVELPHGWEIAQSGGLRAIDSRHATLVFDQQADRSLSLRVRHVGLSGLWDAITD